MIKFLIKFSTLSIFCIISLDSMSGDKEQFLFKKSLELIQSGKYQAAKNSIEQLKGSPYHIYLTYKLIQRRPYLVSKDHPKIFLARKEDSVFQDLFRKQWLNKLFQRKKYREFITTYESKPIDGLEYKCKYFQSKIKIEPMSVPFKKIIDTWSVGKSLPRVCDYPFNYLYKNNLISTEDYWERISKALDKKNFKLARYLANKSENIEMVRAIKIIRKYYQKPERYIQSKTTIKNSFDADILVKLTQRAMNRNLEKGLLLQATVTKKLALNPKQIQRLKLQSALIASYKRDPKSITLLDALDDSQIDSRIQRLQIQQAIIHKSWDKLLKWTLQRPKSEIPSSRWLYWRAYAASKAGHHNDATKIFRQLAERRDYYGFLAADQLSQPYSFNNKKIIFDNQTYREIILTTNLDLADKLFTAGRELDAKREFLYSIKKFDNTKLHAAALLADSWGWPKGAIFAIGKSSEMHDLKLRFPILYKDTISNYLKPKNTYRVKTGDSLWKISKKLNVSVKIIANNNNIKGDLLRPGQILNIPSFNKRTSPIDLKVYKVRRGDTLSGIAKRFDTSINFLKKNNRIKNINKLKIGQPIRVNNIRIKRQHRVSEHQILAIIRAESAFDRFARSPANARGLMQLIPSTAKLTARKHGFVYRRKSDLYNAEKNIFLGSSYLEDLYNKFNGNFAMATAGYNAGPHRVLKWQRRYCGDPVLWIDIIPITETRRYVRRTLLYSLIYEWQQTGKSNKLSNVLKSIPITKSNNKKVCQL